MQGDIFKKVVPLVWDLGMDGLTFTDIAPAEELKFAIVLSQECDLDQDYNNWRDIERKNEDKYLPSVLVCPAYPSEQLRFGKHREDMKMSNLGDAGVFPQIEKNTHPRYHFLKSATEADNEKGINVISLVVDFKHYYTLPTNAVYKLYNEHYVGSLNELFREELSHRFSAYLSRVGLPFVDPIECDEGIE